MSWNTYYLITFRITFYRCNLYMRSTNFQFTWKIPPLYKAFQYFKNVGLYSYFLIYIHMFSWLYQNWMPMCMKRVTITCKNIIWWGQTHVTFSKLLITAETWTLLWKKGVCNIPRSIAHCILNQNSILHFICTYISYSVCK